MRARDPRASIADALAAAQAIERFMDGCSFAQYLADEMLHSAVERQFEIVGEALSRALKANPALIERIPEAPKVIGLRNVLAHGYDAVVDATIFELARGDLPSLVERLRAVLEGIA
jgi:uncharacterized protein with HEPN domain